MERTNKISEDCDQLLNDTESYVASNINSGFNKNISSDEDDDIELRNKDFSSATKRYAEVSQSYPETTPTSTKRFSDLKLEAFANLRLYAADDERQSLIQEEATVDTSGNDIDQSRNSTMTDTGILAEDECTSSGSGCSEASSNRLCDISILERLLRTHSLWFIPGIQRSGAVHLLQGKEEGVSIYLRRHNY